MDRTQTKKAHQFLAETIVILHKCADSLQASIEAEYAGTQNVYPSQKRRFDRDMEPVIHAKQTIAQYEKGDFNG